MSTPVERELRPSVKHVMVKPMAVHPVAEICGVDLRHSLGCTEVAAIRQALLDGKVVFFPDHHSNCVDSGFRHLPPVQSLAKPR